MVIDWGFAWRLGGIGFGVVFVVLIILAVVTWLTGLVINKIGNGEDEIKDRQKGV